ncbi:Nascent polypeptide-associated complex subunit beta [Naganishia cerealis]|uniref:Nascent polypeptide-associated complex subunit beta n=1 Tax=Naganishia cerealis TaxID=610337 RepID=A0ACC2WAS6_9TREE|nr:Nascent polypeptide-associated complex subunit beta [Naganishia cerealis]
MDPVKLAKLQAQNTRLGTIPSGRIESGEEMGELMDWERRGLAMAHRGRVRLQRLALKTGWSKRGTPRRKQIKKSASTKEGDDRKIQAALGKLNVQPITGVEEVNMFKEDGTVLHFQTPRVNSALPSNTIAITGQGQDKELPELVPGILNQLGPDSLASLRKLAESYQAMAQKQQGAAGESAEGETKEADDEDVPDLVENFDVEESTGNGEKETAKLEELN